MPTLKYFAYGSNMLTERLRRRVPSTVPLGHARLDGWQLCFHKRGADGSAKCDIIAGESVVHGVLFEIDADHRGLLDHVEGLGRGYDLAHVTLHSVRGQIDAFCYVATASHIDPSLLPFGWYRDFVEYGALEHGLPAAYIRRIRQVETLVDGNGERSEKNRRVVAASEPMLAVESTTQ
jgi:gamma-glutamylcyclotransferase (GGCT)/AIG2-like uncharacterized protein YtfP